MATNTYVALATQTLATSSASVTFSSVPQTYTDLVLVASGISDGINVDFGFRFNGDTGTNYSRIYLYGNGSSALTGTSANNTYMNILNFSNVQTEVNRAFIQNYSNSTTYKTCLSRIDDAAGLGTVAEVGTWRSTAAVTTIQIVTTSSAVFQAGTTFTLYGIAAAPQLAAKATGGTITTTVDGYVIHTFTSNGTFTPISGSLNCEYLVVAGGGGGASAQGGGGGAGGFRTGTGLSVSAATTVTIGAGGSAGANGADSVFGAITSNGGGYGGASSPNSGGSGGGAGLLFSSGTVSGGAGNTPSTSPSQGNNGGTTISTGGVAYGSGGGGAGAVGGSSTNGGSGGQSGGIGAVSSISGIATYYAGGGGSSNAGTGGLGGGGNANNAGTANTGGGGGALNGGSGNGGSGIVIVRYLG